MFDDYTMAGVLTYIRRSWGNEADTITPETVKKVRAATKAGRASGHPKSC